MTVENKWGHTLKVSRDIVENMHSGSHYAKEVPMNLSDLAELLVSLSDNVFTCKLRSLPSVQAADEHLRNFKYNDLED